MTGLLTILLCIFWALVTSAATILTSNDTMSWWNTVEFCAKEKKILRKERPELKDDVSERFWTRIYEKEHFVYLIGCFKPSQINTSTPTNMTIAECLTCLNHHPFMFAKYMNAENHWCSCVHDTLPDPPDGCDLSEHVFVFGANDGYQKRKHGVQLKCINNKPILIQKESHKKRNLFCNNTVIPGKFTWQKAKERCKKASGTLGKLKFDDFCKTTDIKAWFGFGTVTSKEEHIKHSELLVTKETKPTSVNVLTTRHVSQGTTITSDPITNQSTHDFATGDVYSAIKTNSSTMATILTSKDTMSWRDAVEFCAKEKKILRKGRPDLNEDVSERFWTRIYKKEHFVYLIGCFKPSQIKTSTPTNMTDEECLTCLNHHPFMFAKYMKAEENWCSCVYGTLPDPTNQCELSEHVFVFGANDGYQKRRYGVHLTCIHNKPTLIQKESHKKRNLFCNNKVIPGEFTWQNAIERCKKASGMLGNLNFDDFCKRNNTKAWFGFGTIISEEEYMKHSDLLEPKRCQSCTRLCQFENCSEHRKPNCESTHPHISYF
uniref:Uncharacterized protein LOC111121744 isoform X2 n=1 Tax=Crassostrea virginica TaxID=6565 RepID=A0A8B8CT19_CRAVI|nr:uncharacterized protein LOC111121744 isoform X2 [Crassostrea virginica]